MALFDFLKRKKEVEKSKSAKKVEKDSVVPVAKQPRIRDGKAIGTKEIKKTELASASPGRSSGASKKSFSYDVIKEPHISEKATNLAEENKYTFKVYSNANKPEIKKSVQGIYGVDVLGVKIIKIPHKKRRIGRTEGFKKGFTKAVVTIKEGQKIEVF